MCKKCAPTMHAHQNLHDGIMQIMDSLYLLRSAHGTQKEHMDIAEACKKVFIEQFPTVSEVPEWV